MKETDDSSRFTIRDGDEAPDSIYMADAENLRLEKLGTRITLVAVLIPCLLVIVLAVAYLDIKHRVTTTHDSGSIGVQKLSKDLESRFSSLSLKQAKLEEQLAEYSKNLDSATAALQVNLKKSVAELKKVADSKADQSALASMAKKPQTAIAALQNDVADLHTAFDKFDEELAAQITRIADGLKTYQERLAEIAKQTERLEMQTQRLESQTLSKESLNLSLGLERLALQEMVRENMREVDEKLADLSQEMKNLKQRVDKQARTASPPAPFARPSAPAPATPSGSSKIEEQTIN